MEYLKLDKFIPKFVDQNDRLVQWILSTRKEFNEFASKPNEKIPLPGNYFNHQNLLLRAAINFDNLLMIHETGTGKTCGLVAVAEYFKNNSSQIKSVYVLEKGDTTKNDFKNQIVNKCTNNVYKKNSELKKWYKIMTYGDFVNKEIGNQKDEDLIEKFSGCIFFIDEAHNIRNFDKRVSDLGDVAEFEYSEDNYNKIKQLFRKIKRSKVIISTATPMINSPEEIGKLVDLLNPTDIPPFDWENDDLDLLEPYFRGRVSYVRSLDTGIEVVNEGDSQRFIQNPEDLKIVPFPVYHLHMVPGSFQDIIHRQVAMDSSNVWGRPKLASSFVPPFDELQIGNLVIPSDAGMIWNPSYSLVDLETGEKNIKLGKYLSNYNRLKKCSVKFAFIVQNELSYRYNQTPNLVNPAKHGVTVDPTITEKGNAFIYTELVTESGTTYLSLVLQEYGFERFSIKNPPIDQNGKIVIPKRPRFGTIVGHMGEETIAMLEVFNHPDNKNGDYIQIVVGSEIARDGINLSNVTRGYLLTPEWHISGMYQAMSRFVRSTSHRNLVDQKIQELNTLDIPRIEVRVYKLSAVNSDELSTDDYIYAKAEGKDFLTRRIMRFLKRVALDCMIHYDRNVRKDDINGSQNCDYDTCEYKCLTPAPPRHDPPVKGGMAGGQGPTLPEYDYSNYHLYYRETKLLEVEKILSVLLEQYGSITFEDAIDHIYREMPDEHYGNIRYYIYDTIDRMILQKIVFRDIFGFENFIQTDGVNIYSQREYPRETKNYKETGYYSRNIFGNTKVTIDKVISHQIYSTETMENIENLSSPEDIRDYFSELIPSATKRRELFETALTKFFTEKEISVFEQNLIKYYKIFIFPLTEQKRKVKSVESFLTKPHRGAPASSKKKIKVSERTDIDWEIEEDESFETICHIYNPGNDGETRYVDNLYFRPSVMKVRILKLGPDPKWEDISDAEYHIYPIVICEQFRKDTEYERRFGLFGWSYDAREGISFSEDESCFTKKDKRMEKRGASCIDKKPWEILDYFSYFNESDIPDLGMEHSEPMSIKKDEYLKFLTNSSRTYSMSKTFSDEWYNKVYQVYRKYTSGKPRWKKRNICNIFVDIFTQLGIIINIPKV